MTNLMTKPLNPIAASLQSLNAPTELFAEAVQLQPKELLQWIQLIDESPYSVKQWAEALIYFAGWAVSQKRMLKLPHMLEYLNCCTESGIATQLLSLNFLLQEYIRDYGVDESP